jgi:hypothetical protein
LVSEDGAVIECAVAVFVGQQANAPQWEVRRTIGERHILGAIRIGIVPHFSHIGAAIFVVFDGYRIGDQWLGSDQLHFETGLHSK